MADSFSFYCWVVNIICSNDYRILIFRLLKFQNVNAYYYYHIRVLYRIPLNLHIRRMLELLSFKLQIFIPVFRLSWTDHNCTVLNNVFKQQQIYAENIGFFLFCWLPTINVRNYSISTKLIIRVLLDGHITDEWKSWFLFWNS